MVAITDSTFRITDYDVEMDEVTHVPEVDLVDVEMVDDFLPQIPTVITSFGHRPA